MYPYVLNDVTIHYFGEKGIAVNHKDGNHYFLNKNELILLEKCNGNNSIDDIVQETAKEIQLFDILRVHNAISKFINFQMQRNLIGLNEISYYIPIHFTGKKGYEIPMEILLEITNRCNLKCIHCYKEAGYDKKDDIDIKKLLTKLEYFKGHIHSLQISGGEPMSHRYFFDILDYCTRNFSTSLTTTATMINKHNAHRFIDVDNVQVSVYAATPEEHDKITLVPGSFHRTMRGIQELVHKENNVTISSIITMENYMVLEDIIRLAVDMGVQAIKFGEFSRYGRGENLGEEWELAKDIDTYVTNRISELATKYKDRINVENYYDDLLEMKFDYNHKGFSCGAGNLSWTISEFGNIKPCVFLPENRFKTGNIFEDDMDVLFKKNHILNLHTNIVEWEHSLNDQNMSSKQICPVMKNYEEFFDNQLWKTDGVKQ
ncbi:radical SAM protein [Bacillus sp. WLY-B-L8]|uniref:radical SAM protein n=1 Tax=Bacillus multifaciens TaxID=3068506 RepID=UPI0027417E7C|nr:radical SAM protein [Bacillus sp. WLY-B-L8]MDP7978549.1 radical SAM protein [Bacillus sp. WLY-B-L8]